MPDLAGNIRRSRALTKAAVVAKHARAARTLVVTTAVEAELEYHLVQVFHCFPTMLMDGMPHERQCLELRPTKWCRLEQVVRQFLAGVSLDCLIETAAGRE